MLKQIKPLLLSVVIVFAMYLGISESLNFDYNKIHGNIGVNRPTLAIINSGANIEQVNYSMHINLTAYNVIDSSTNIYDEEGVGTKLFSALFNDRFSLNSTNDVLLIKAYEHIDAIEEDNIVKAIDFALENHANVINITAQLKPTETLIQAMNRARSQGVIITMPLFENISEFSQSGVISVTGLNNDEKADVRIDDTHAITCVNNRCNVNQSDALNSIYASEYILRNGIENPRNLIINTIFNIQS